MGGGGAGLPLLIWVGTIYQGEHCAIDAIVGGLYATAAYLVVGWLFDRRRATAHADATARWVRPVG